MVDPDGVVSSTGSGIVRVCVNGRRGTICDSSWNFAEASVACKQAGYSPYGTV